MPYYDNPEFSIISHINITKRKLAEEDVELKNNQLMLINEQIHSSMYKIVHDIQGPLNSIAGLINLSKDSKNSLPVTNYLSLIEGSVDNLKDHIQNTLKMSNSFLKVENIDFKLLVNELFKFIKYDENLQFIRNEIHINQNSLFYSFKSEITSILSNIINNSIKYYDKTKLSPFVIIDIFINEKEAFISIKDNGIGISNEILPRIFDFNFQANNKSETGSGIGLFMVKKSIDLLNGQIKVESEIGIGTEFTITIPNHYFFSDK